MDAARTRVDYGQPMRFPAWISRPKTAAVADAALALVLFVAGQAETWLSFGTGLGHGSDVVTALLGAGMTLPLAFRRRYPIAVALFVSIPTPLVGLFTDLHLLFFGGLLPILTVTYTLASRALPPRSLAPLALPLAMLVAVELEVPEFRRVGEITFDWLWVAVTIGIGLVVRSRSLHAARSETRAVRLEGERDAVLREERARIARELHDVIAHSVSVIVVQAGAAELLVEENPEQVRLALHSIRSTASDALGEMRRLLGILRAAGDELSLAPQPTVAELEPLLAQARAGGLDVELRVEGTPRLLAPGIDLAAYRIVQEALTNTRKHARASRATVALRYTPAVLEIDVHDDGTEAAADSAGGHGLVGMRERVGLYNGALEVGSCDGGGFFVRAVLPT
jgi:signal transduction histidine kinase